MFENLSNKLEKAFKVLKGKGSISDINVAETMKEIRRALLDADVSYPIAKEFTDKVKSQALGMNVLQSVEPGQMMVKIVKDELTKLMGSEAVDINIKGSPAIVLIAGLQGSGKTTFSAKLANYLKNKKNKSVMLAAGDVYRPAAIDQLKIVAVKRGNQDLHIPTVCKNIGCNRIVYFPIRNFCVLNTHIVQRAIHIL